MGSGGGRGGAGIVTSVVDARYVLNQGVRPVMFFARLCYVSK